MTSFLTFDLSSQPTAAKMPVIMVISLFLDQLSLNLVWKVKIKWKQIYKQIDSSKSNCLYYFLQTRKIRLRFWLSLAKHLLRIGLPWQQLRSLVTKKLIPNDV